MRDVLRSAKHLAPAICEDVCQLGRINGPEANRRAEQENRDKKQCAAGDSEQKHQDLERCPDEIETAQEEQGECKSTNALSNASQAAQTKLRRANLDQSRHWAQQHAIKVALTNKCIKIINAATKEFCQTKPQRGHGAQQGHLSQVPAEQRGKWHKVDQHHAKI